MSKLLEPTLDEYATMLNSSETVEWIQTMLIHHGSVFFAWTDEDMTQLDILICVEPDTHPKNIKLVQRGLRMTDLFVSVIGCGAFGFQKDQTSSPSYYAEKLGIVGSKTTEKLAELLNDVRQNL